MVRSKLRGWEVLNCLHVSPAGFNQSFRLSRDILPPDMTEPQDATGLDVRLESVLEGAFQAAGRGGGRRNLVRAFHQHAEFVVGPRAQQKYLNMSLPCSVLLGAAASTQKGVARMRLAGADVTRTKGHFGVYTSLLPAVPALRGWAWRSRVMNSRWGALYAGLAGPWSRKGREWFLQHRRNYSAVPLLAPLARGAAALGAEADGVADLGVVVPTTRVWADSGDAGVTVGLQSPELLQGGSGWGVEGDVSRQGWGTSLRVRGARTSKGNGEYSFLAGSYWQEPIQSRHTLSYVSHGKRARAVAGFRSDSDHKRLRFALEMELPPADPRATA